jgi:uncharacterized protein
MQLQPMLEPNTIEVRYDHIDHVDILAIEPFEATYQITKKAIHYVLHIEASVSLTLACAKTLKPVKYVLELNEDITFGDDIDADFIIEPEIDFNQLMMGLIVSSKPLVVYHPESDGIEFEGTKKESIFKTLLED